MLIIAETSNVKMAIGLELIDLYFNNLLYLKVYINIVALIAEFFKAQISHFQRVLGSLKR